MFNEQVRVLTFEQELDSAVEAALRSDNQADALERQRGRVKRLYRLALKAKQDFADLETAAFAEAATTALWTIRRRWPDTLLPMETDRHHITYGLQVDDQVSGFVKYQRRLFAQHQVAKFFGPKCGMTNKLSSSLVFGLTLGHRDKLHLMMAFAAFARQRAQLELWCSQLPDLRVDLFAFDDASRDLVPDPSHVEVQLGTAAWDFVAVLSGCNLVLGTRVVTFKLLRDQISKWVQGCKFIATQVLDVPQDIKLLMFAYLDVN